MRRWIVAFIFALTGGFLSFTYGANTGKDSLLRALHTSPPDSTRLAILYELSCLDQMSPTCEYYINRMLQEAIAQKNIHYQCRAMYANVVYYFNHQDPKNVESWMRQLENLSLKSGYSKLYFAGKNVEIMMSLVNRKIEYSITEAQKMYEEARKVNSLSGMATAKVCLMTAYMLTARYEEGMRACEDAYALLFSPELKNERVNILQNIVLACHLTNNKNFYKYLKMYDSAIKEADREELSENVRRDRNLMLASLYVGYYLQNNRLDMVPEHLKNMDLNYSDSGFIPCRGLYYDAYSDYYRAVKEYDKSLAYADTAFALLSAITENGGVNLRIKKADILADAGKLDEAIALYKKTLSQKDSIYRDLSVSQMDEVYEMYNMDKLLLEKERYQTIVHTIELVLIGLALLAFIPFTLRIYYVRRKLKKDESDMREMSRVSEEVNQIKEDFLTNMSYNVRASLNNVVGFSQLIAVDPGISEEERTEYASIVRSNSAELIQLVGDVLDLSRLESGRMKFQMQEYDVTTCCNDIVSMCNMESKEQIEVELQLEVTGISFEIDFSLFSRLVLSTLLYPDTEGCKEKRKVRLTVNCDHEKNLLVFRIYNSPLADAAFHSQKVDIRHEINRLLISRFGGIYRVDSTKKEETLIVFTYPILG